MATTSNNEESLFLKSIRAFIADWTALQAAIENGFGGSDAKGKEAWMGPVVEQFFQENQDLEIDEIADFIGEILYNEFDTVVEDGSLDQISMKLLKIFNLCKAGKEDEVNQKLEEITAKLQRTRNTANASNTVTTCVQQMESLEISNELNNCDDNHGAGDSEAMDTSWTVVNRKSHKKK